MASWHLDTSGRPTLGMQLSSSSRPEGHPCAPISRREKPPDAGVFLVQGLLPWKDWSHNNDELRGVMNEIKVHQLPCLSEVGEETKLTQGKKKPAGSSFADKPPPVSEDHGTEPMGSDYNLGKKRAAPVPRAALQRNTVPLVQPSSKPSSTSTRRGNCASSSAIVIIHSRIRHIEVTSYAITPAL